MELELVSVSYQTDVGTKLEGTICVVKDTPLDSIISEFRHALRMMTVIHGTMFINWQEVGRVAFHQEDAHALGLKVNTVL